MMGKSEWHELKAETGQIWENLAGFWDDYMGDDGNDFHCQLVAPTALKLLQPKPGERLLDAACGNGTFVRQLAKLGASVVGCDVSQTFVQRARERSQAFAENVTYQVADLTDLDQILGLGEASFDGAVCNMAVMDLPVIEPLFSGVRRLLRPGGRFVLTLSHPCFMNIGARKTVEQEERDGDSIITYGVKVVQYLTPMHDLGQGIGGQPEPHHFFDRPLNMVLNACFQAGFVMDGFEEASFQVGMQADSPFSWENYPDIPPVLGIRFRPA